MNGHIINIDTKLRADTISMVINENKKQTWIKDGALLDTCISTKGSTSVTIQEFSICMTYLIIFYYKCNMILTEKCLDAVPNDD